MPESTGTGHSRMNRLPLAVEALSWMSRSQIHPRQCLARLEALEAVEGCISIGTAATSLFQQ
jgi:hypothetical protein